MVPSGLAALLCVALRWSLICEICENCILSHAFVGEHVIIAPGVNVGQPGFNLHTKSIGGHDTQKDRGLILRIIAQSREESHSAFS